MADGENLPPQPEQPVEIETPQEPAVLVPPAEPTQSAGGSEDIIFEAPKEGGSRLGLWIGIIVVVLILIVGGIVAYVLLRRQSVPEVPATETTTTLTPAQQRDQTRKSDLASIKNALDLYFTDTGSYPKTDGVVKTNSGDNVLRQTLVPNYLSSLAVDPQDPTYYYGYKSDGATYELSSILEDTSDSEGTVVGNLTIYKLTP